MKLIYLLIYWCIDYILIIVVKRKKKLMEKRVKIVVFFGLGLVMYLLGMKFYEVIVMNFLFRNWLCDILKVVFLEDDIIYDNKCLSSEICWDDGESRWEM